MSKSSEHCWGDFFTRWREPEEEWFWRFEKFSKLKTAFCEYWTSIKIKISMICVSKEYEIKTKMVQEQWLQLKMTFLFFYWVELAFDGEGIKIWWGGRGWENFYLVGGTSPIPPVGKTLGTYIHIYPIYICKRTLTTGFYMQWASSAYIIYIMCQSGHLTSARFEHFVCHRYIWSIFSLVCSVLVLQ